MLLFHSCYVYVVCHIVTMHDIEFEKSVSSCLLAKDTPTSIMNVPVSDTDPCLQRVGLGESEHTDVIEKKK